MSDYTRWYRDGSASVTKGSKIVVGTGTYWDYANLNPGDLFTPDNGQSFYEISAITDSTHLTLKTNYAGNTASNVDYAIVRNFTSSTQAKLASATAELISDFARYIDSDMTKLNGKSAYEIAKDNGYTGTEQQWLESLIGAGQWETLDTRTELLKSTNNYETRNSISRGISLGNTFTAEQAAAIASGSFDGLPLGGNWNITVPSYSWTDSAGTVHNESSPGAIHFRIAAFDYFRNTKGLPPHHIVVVTDNPLFSAAMHSSNDNSVGYLGTNMVTNHLKRAEALVKAAFGANHIIEHQSYLCNAMTDGHPTGVEWATRTVDLMSEQMVFGGKICGSANTGSSSIMNNTECKTQLPLFLYMPAIIRSTSNYWLRDPAAPHNFVFVHTNGNVSYTTATTSAGVRPYVCVGEAA